MLLSDVVGAEVPRYTGIGNCFGRIYSEQGLAAFWRGNFTNCIRYFPTQAFNLAFKDSIKKMFPKYSPKTEFGKFFLVNLASGGLAAAGSLSIVYPLDYARTRLASGKMVRVGRILPGRRAAFVGRVVDSIGAWPSSYGVLRGSEELFVVIDFS